jgi:hypothetical protein
MLNIDSTYFLQHQFKSTDDTPALATQNWTDLARVDQEICVLKQKAIQIAMQ